MQLFPAQGRGGGKPGGAPAPFLDAFDRRVAREKVLGRVWTACKIRHPLPSSNHSHHRWHPWVLWTHLLLNTHPVVREHPTHTPTHREDVVTMGGAARLPQLSLEVRKCGLEHWLSSCCLTLGQLPLCLQAPHFTQPLQGGCATNSRGPPQMGNVASVGQGRGLDSGPHRADSSLHLPGSSKLTAISFYQHVQRTLAM